MMKRLLVFLMILLVAVFVYSDNTILNNSQINLTYGETYNYNFTNSTNDTIVQPFFCRALNISPVCSFSRGLTYGENFVLNDGSCNLQFSCPSQQFNNGNVSHTFEFFITGNNQTLNIRDPENVS